MIDVPDSAQFLSFEVEGRDAQADRIYIIRKLMGEMSDLEALQALHAVKEGVKLR